MKLTVLERLMALGVLPEKGSLVNMRLIQGLVLKLGLSPEEMEKYEMREENEKMIWRPDIEQETDIDLKAAEIVFLADILKKKDQAEELTAQHLSFYDKIVKE